MAMIEIWDTSNVSLEELLKRLPLSEDLKWSVMDIWAVGRDDDSDIAGLEKHVAESPCGLQLGERELRDFARGLAQLVDGVVVGYRGDPPKRSDEDLRASAEIIIESIDSTLWRLYSRDAGTLDRIRTEYGDVRSVDSDLAIPAVHSRS